MSKTATPPPKKTTTATSGERKTAKPAAKRTPAKPTTARKPSPVAKSNTSDKSYKSTAKNPTVNRRVTVGLPKGSAASKAKNPTVNRRVSKAKAAPPPAPPVPVLPREGFQRASLTLTATVSHGNGHSSHETGLSLHQNARQAHGKADSARGTQAGTSARPGVPQASQAAPGHEPAGTPDAQEPAGKPLTFIEERFAFEYVQDGNQTRAYMRATGTTHFGSAATAAYKLMKKDEIRARIEFERQELQKRAGVTAEALLRRLWDIATADARELIEYVVGACRYCHGEGHQYHRTSVEFERDRKEFETHGRQRIDGMYLSSRKKKERQGRRAKGDEVEEEFEVQGGPGYDPHREPHPTCPQCHGDGHGRALIRDTRTLSVGASLLYAGIKETKEGIEVKMLSPMDAIEKIAKHIGFYEADNRGKDRADPFTELLNRISGPSAALPINPDPQEGNDA